MLTSIMDLCEYRKFVEGLVETESPRVFLNSDEGHALVVMENLIRQSQNEIKILAGNLQHIGNEDVYIQAMSDFVERGGKVRILLNDCDDHQLLKDSNLFKRLAYYIKDGKDIIVKTTNVKPYFKSDPLKRTIHFSIGDEKGYRLETDTEHRTAECSMNQPERASQLSKFFDGVFTDEQRSQELNLIQLFEDGTR